LRAVLCNGFDGIKALTVGEAPEPHAAPDEVLIEVHAASVSYMDYLMICGGYQMRPTLPYVPGTDAAGVVVACGEKVERFRPGDRVTCENWFGGFAERMTAKASRTARLPANTDFIVGSTLLHIYLTAWYALVDRARLQAGETVLVTGASGGVGLACVSSRIFSEAGSSRPLEVLPRPQSFASTALKRSSTIRARTSATG
jgi:NADPH:quinone reductase